MCKTSRLDAFGDHTSHCRHYPCFKYKHDHVREILFDVVLRAGMSLKKETHVNFLKDPKGGWSTLPTDFLIYNWSGDKHACVDLTSLSSGGLGNGAFEVGQTAISAASTKIEKHEGACTAN